MKRGVFILFLALAAPQLPAETNEPTVKLGIISETPETGTAVDVLTTEFSKNDKLQLLERAEIDKVYREQGLSAANTDYLKLGQVLGADGLLLLETTQEGTNQFLNVRLVAVKPGVVLVAERFSWPMTDITEWSPLFSKSIDPFLPKLSVLEKNAIPISVVNLRSAVASAEAAETERQLKLLAIQRLSQEQQLFILERQKMQLLGEEKDLQADASPFWNGAYLLEGVVDQNGYSVDTITINARLTPSKGGTPLLLEASGSRTNLAEVINQLAAKVISALKINPTVIEWNTADEAAQYFDEAKWAMRWGAYAEAQTAADSAWALGKQDLPCALVRIKSYENPPSIITIAEEGVIDSSMVDSADESDRDSVIKQIKRIADTHAGAFFEFIKNGISYVTVEKQPDPQNLDRLIRALEMYRQFSEMMSPDDLRTDSDWYERGVGVLTATAQTLQYYYLVPQSQVGVTEKLSDLRALARWTEGWILKQPLVHDSYFAIASKPNHLDDPRRMLTDAPNIFQCEVDWGCFWQERPEDCVVLYQELLGSPGFAQFNDEFGSSAEYANSRGLERPRLVAWNDGDKKRIPEIWDSLLRGLNDSTNVFLQDEAKKFQEMDAPAALNEEDIITQYDEYWKDIQTAKINVRPPGIHDQNETWDLTSAINDFVSTESSPAQAQEIEPSLATYKSNLIRLMQAKSGSAKFNLELAIKGVADVQAKVERILNERPPAAVTKAGVQPPPSEPVQMEVRPMQSASENAADALLVGTCLKIPQASFPRDEQWSEDDGIRNLQVVGSHWCEGKLIFDLRYKCQMHINGGEEEVTKAVAAIFNPANQGWEIISLPPVAYENGYPRWSSEAVSLEIYQGDLYLVQNAESMLEGNLVGFEGQLLKYDFQTRQWIKLVMPAQGIVEGSQQLLQLSVVNQHLYAASSDCILEISGSGAATRILASTRRHPAASTLDSLDNLGTPVLFSALDDSLCAFIGNKTCRWDGNDWRELFATKVTTPPEVFEDAVIFRFSPLDYFNESSMIWLWDKHQGAPELALYEKPVHEAGSTGWPQASQDLNPVWKPSLSDSLTHSTAAFYKSNLYFLVDHANVVNVSGQWTVTEKDGCHARLMCLCRGQPEPIVVPLKFDLQQGQPPLKRVVPWQTGSNWMFFSGDMLYLGQSSLPGIWAIPISEVNAAMAQQKKIMAGKKTGANPQNE